MKINIYDSELNRVAIVGEHYISCFWAEGYNTTEPFTLELNDTDQYRKAAKLDYYVGRTDRNTLMVIKSVNIGNGRIVLSGRQATQVLDDVSMIGTIEKNQYIDEVVPQRYSISNKYPNVEFTGGDFLGVQYPSQISHKSFLELCEIMCQETDTGFKAIKGNGIVAIIFYKPEKNKNLIFSQRFGNLNLSDIVLSNSNAKNYAIVLGAGEGENRKRLDVDITNGDKRRDIIIDASDIQYDETDTDETYNEKLYARGVEKLLEHLDTAKVNFIPSGNDFGTRFDLGDILTVNLPEYGLKIESRVIRFSQKAQSNKTETTVEVGNMTIKR